MLRTTRQAYLELSDTLCIALQEKTASVTIDRGIGLKPRPLPVDL